MADRASKGRTPIRRRLRNLFKKLGVSLVATAVCLAILEVVFRIAGYRPLYDIYSKPDMFWRYDAQLGWSQEPGARGVFVGPRPFPIEFRGDVRINSLGLRGPEIEPVPVGGYRVMFLGDSVVAGFEVEEDATFEGILQTRLSADLGIPVQVVNAGVRGYGTDQSYIYYRDRGSQLHPDLVVFVASNNDLEDNTTLHRARRPFGKAAFRLEPDGSLEPVGSPVPQYPFCSGWRTDASFRPVEVDTTSSRTMCWLESNLADHSALFTFVTLRIQQNAKLVYKMNSLGTPDAQTGTVGGTGPIGAISPAGRLTTALIRKMAEVARSAGSHFAMVIDYKYDLVALDKEALAADGIPILFDWEDLQVDGSFKGFTWKSDSHFNEKGHARFADLLEPRLLEQLKAIGAARTLSAASASVPARPPAP